MAMMLSVLDGVTKGAKAKSGAGKQVFYSANSQPMFFGNVCNGFLIEVKRFNHSALLWR